MNRSLLIAVFALATRFSFAEVQVIKGGESDQPAGERSATILHTRDRDIVPAVVTTKETKTGPNTGRTDTITRLRDNQGSYFEWQRSSAVSKETAPGTIERTTEVIELDRQGGERERKLIKQTTQQTASGVRSTTAEYRPNSSGESTLMREVSSASTKDSGGAVTEARTISEYDVNGRAVVTRQLESVAITEGNQTTTTTTDKSVNHLHGGITPISREIATSRKDSNQTTTETLRQKPSGATWENDGRTTVIQTQSPDGSIQRETIVEGRSLYARQGGRADSGDLVPQTKTVDREVRQPDGTVVILRDMYRRDVNGDWKPTTFSTEGAQRGY